MAKIIGIDYDNGEMLAVYVETVEGRQKFVRERHGEWEDYHFVKVDCPRNGFPTVKCSACGITFCDIINVHRYMYKFCPHCGANMGGKENNNAAD